MTRVGLLAALGSLGGCTSFQWRLSTSAPAAELDWTRAFGAPAALAVDGDTLFVAAESGLYAVGSGRQKLWADALPSARRALAVAEGKVVVSDGGGHVIAYDAASGAQLWDLPFEGALSPPVVGQGRAALVANNLLVVVDLAGGALAWKQPIAVDNAPMRALRFSRVAPAFAAGQVCAGLAWEFNVSDLATGARGAHEDAGGGGVSASLVSDGALCYFPQSRVGGEGKNTVWAVAPGGAHFSPSWTRDLGGDASDLGISNLALAGDLIYAVTNARVVALEKKNGALKWQVVGRPVAPPSQTRGTRAEPHAFIEGLPPVTAFNEFPGRNFVVGGGKLFIAARGGDPQARDVVTVLDALTGDYLGSWDAGASVVRDLQLLPDHTLMVATSDGLRRVPTGGFVAVSKK